MQSRAMREYAARTRLGDHRGKFRKIGLRCGQRGKLVKKTTGTPARRGEDRCSGWSGGWTPLGPVVTDLLIHRFRT